ncbi:MAG TPA: DUF3617 domain-containing protein [Rhizomicrobium sp.]|jgi:hypothetical protein
MPLRPFALGAGVLGVGLLVLPVAAFAAHGKAGLWEITSQMNMAGVLSPEQMAQMQAHGVQMPMAQKMSTQHCMTAAEVAADGPPPMRDQKECKMSNAKYDAHAFTADMICSGEMTGQGHLAVTFDGNEHYNGTYSFVGSAHGHPANVSVSYEGKWVSPDCGTVK